MAKEGTWLDNIENLRVAIDISTRPHYNFETDHYSRKDFFGLDIHKVFSKQQGGDIGTLILQGYFTNFNDVEYPAYLSNRNDSSFTCRICNFNLALSDSGKFNLRFGHAEIPYGLEYNIDSNGTLRQFSNGRDLGNKLAWGIAANGKINTLGYELTVSRGTGKGWTNDSRNYLTSGRVEIINDYSKFVGLSAFYGRIRLDENSPSYTNRSRLGLDASLQKGLFTLIGELSVGKDNDDKRLTALLEIDLQNPNEQVLTYLQVKNDSKERNNGEKWDSVQRISLGLRYTPNRFWTLSSQWNKDFNLASNAQQTNALEVQLRYRF